MNESIRLAEQVKQAVDGGAWHGPAWNEVLEGVTREQAMARPIPAAHTIAEIALHALTWHDVVRRRLLGESPQPTDAEDWPTVHPADDAAWSLIAGRVLQTGRELQGTVAAIPPDRLHERRPGTEGTWYELIIGELQHMLYHAGQIAILRKASAHR
jgi:hypothetical protein